MIQLNPEHSIAQDNLGQLYEGQGLIDEAMSCYENSIKLDNMNEDAWFSKAIALDMLGKRDETLKCMQEILKINPNNESAKEAMKTYEEKGTFNFN